VQQLSRVVESSRVKENTVLKAPLSSNGYPIVEYKFVTEMSLPSRCLVMGIHVTKLKWILEKYDGVVWS
jgi:hypothetical protein